MYDDLMQHDPQTDVVLNMTSFNETLRSILERGNVNYLLIKNVSGNFRHTTHTLMYNEPWYGANIQFGVYDEILEGEE